MKEDEIFSIIDKLALADISLSELNVIKDIVDTDGFIENYNLVTSLKEGIQPFGREMLQNEIKEASKKYHSQAKIFVINNVSQKSMLLVAASLVIICLATIFNLATDYNNPKNYRKENLAIASLK